MIREAFFSIISDLTLVLERYIFFYYVGFVRDNVFCSLLSCLLWTFNTSTPN